MTLGTTEFLLPSRGVLYDGKVPDGRVDLRPMNAKQQALLQTQGGGIVGKLDAIIDTCCTLPNGFAHKDLLLTDRFAILLALRTKTFGGEYTFKWKCRTCGKQNTSTVDITKELNEKPGVPGQTVEPIVCELPVKGTKVSLRFLRGTDEAQVAKNAKRYEMSSNDPNDPSYLYRVAMQLVDEDGKPFPNILDKQRFVENMHARDLITIEDAVTEAETGIDSKLFLDCSKCDSTNEMGMPFTAEFFRPRRAGG
jgi:hypothetical protein